MGILGHEVIGPEIEFRFPALWSKLSTSLEPIDGPREKFQYKAKNYDELIDCPVEIGCQETDGFMLKGVPHSLAFFGETYPHDQNLKKDMQTVCETVVGLTSKLPFKNYQFIKKDNEQLKKKHSF
jgi:predicted metalloprotease with PDZ domain